MWKVHQGIMYSLVRGWFVIGVIILQYEFRIISAQLAQKDKAQTSRPSETPIPKTTQKYSIEHSTPYITPVSSFPPEATNVYASSEINFSIMHQFSSPLPTPSLPTSQSLFYASSHYLLNSSIPNSTSDDISSHRKSKAVSISSVDVPSSYLLNHSSYLFEDSIYSEINKLLENSDSFIEDSLRIVDSSLDEIKSDFPSDSETSIILSSTIDSEIRSRVHDISSTIPTVLNTLSPVAESRIHILSSQKIIPLSTSFRTDKINTNSELLSNSGDFDLVEVSTIDATTALNEIEASKLLEFLNENSSPDHSNIIMSSLHSLSTNSNSLSLGIQNTSTAGSLKLILPTASSTVIKELLYNSEAPLDEGVSIKNTHLSSHSDLLLESESEVPKQDELFLESEKETHKHDGISHEIIDDSNPHKNKTSRNEDPHLDEIISGIVHLLAGNVQLARPVPNLFPSHPKRQNRPAPFHSTRINNRGPFSSSTFSRTVVVFSQPHNPGNVATEILRPVQFMPSATGGPLLSRPSDKNMHVIRIQPTKVGEKSPPGASVIRFYHPGGKIPTNKQGQPPFVGEIFSHNGLPLSPNVQLTNIPEGAILTSITEQIKLQNQKGNSESTYPHFIFSDASGSSVVVVVSSFPSKIQTIETFTTAPVKPAATTKNTPSKTFEVLTDTSDRQIGIPSSKPSTIPTLKPSEDLRFKESISGGSFRPTSVQIDVPTADNYTIPFGPVTDWVPFLERPSMNFKPSNVNKTRNDNDVSIIMQPIIFDITVSNSLGESKIHDTRMNGNKTSKHTPSSSSIHNDKTSLHPSEKYESYAISTTELQISKTSSSNPQNEPMLTSKHTLFPDENKITITPTRPVEKTEMSFTLQTLRTTLADEKQILRTTLTDEKQTLRTALEDDKSSTQKHSSKKQDPKSTIPSSHTLLSSRSEDKVRLQNTYRATSTLNSLSSRTFGTSISTYSNNQPPLGRPIVIPVDIEEVRPFVGAINPVTQDKTRGTYPSYQGGAYPYPVPPVQVTRAGVNAKEDFSTSLSPTTFQASRTPIIRSQPRPRPNTIRIDTCIVGDDSTCDSKVNETCKTEHGISSCHCRPGYARSYTRSPCIPVVSFILSLKVDRLGNRKILFSPKYMDKNSEEYRIMEFEAKQALSSLFPHTAFSRIFLGMNVNQFYSIAGKLIVNSSVFLEEKESTRAQSVRLRLRQEIGEAIKKRNQNIGESRLYVEGPLSPIINIEDVNECSDPNLNDCAEDGACLNIFGTFLCKCRTGHVDPFKHDERRSGRKCLACSPEYCTYHGQCFVERDQKLCKCQGNYIGSRCEIDGEVLGVALGASLAAIIIILLTLSCLCIWNRKWKKQQQKAEVLSARSYNSNQTFSYLSNMMNANINANTYQPTMEDRMRWAHISDVVKNASLPNPEQHYASTALECSPPRFQYPSDEEVSWYEYRTRPRSRVLSHPGISPNATYYEMESTARGPYATSYHSTKRLQNPQKMLRY